MKKKTITIYKKEIKDLKESLDECIKRNEYLEKYNNELYDQIRSLKDNLNKYKSCEEEFESLQKQKSFSEGFVEGMNKILDKICLESNISFKNMSTDEIVNKYMEYNGLNRKWR